MTKVLYNRESLNRHGVTEAEADEVVATGIWNELTSSERGNDRLMFVGFTSGGRLLEVGVEYFDSKNMEYVFHADDATRHYRALFKKGKNR
jgi:uncharacterized DUF497 family protein